MSIVNLYDVIVIGGGPAGMMAAGTAGKRGLRVLLIEKNAELGKKLSITGGGRCNVTNAEFDVRALLKNYGNAEPFLYSPLAQFGVQSTFDFFDELKLPLVVEDRKRAFPNTQKAPDVTKVMVEYVKNNNVTVLYDTEVEGFRTENNIITGILTTKGLFTANSYVVGTGGKSHADTGSTGEALEWLKKLGHTVHESNPDLVPLMVHDTWVKKLSGTGIQNARITFIQGEEKLVKDGNILCTHFGLSGPLILNSAHVVKQMLEKGNVEARIDLFPGVDVGALRARFQSLYEAHPNKTLTNLLREWFPQGIVEAILEVIPLHEGRPTSLMPAHTLTREVRHTIIDRMKSLPLTITGTMGYDWAVVSDGGVDLHEIDTRTMQSKLHSNLYFVGDILHINRPSGGFSLQLCWTTGFVAGMKV
jgi:predicted Rossmann fold flavoprotein